MHIDISLSLENQTKTFMLIYEVIQPQLNHNVKYSALVHFVFKIYMYDF